jgi:hypothetical protein
MNSRTIFLPKLFVLVVLASIFALGFLITPYWNHVSSKPELMLFLALTIAIGALWSFLSAGDVRIQLEPIKLGYLLILLAGLVILNLRPITASIPWRGDEDVHIAKTVDLALKIPIKWVLPFLAAFVLLLVMAWKKSKWTFLPGLLLIAGVTAFNLMIDPLAEISSYQLLRYPYINYWFFAIVPKLALLAKVNAYQEAYYRIVPFLSTFALGWVFQNQLSGSKPWLKLLWGLAAASLPLVYFFSSSLYLELPAVVLMLVVCINIKSLLRDDFQKIRQNPAWLALILIGFVKETTVPFLVCFLGWRIIASLLHKRMATPTMKHRLSSLLGEASIFLSVLLPVLLYLLLRGTLSEQTRGYSFTISNLTNLLVYRTILQSFLQQFGVPLLLLFGGGVVVLILEKDYLQAGFLLFVACLYPLFHAADVLAYTGFSRFNLFVLPALLASAVILIQCWVGPQKVLGSVLVFVILAFNLWMSPIFIDGTRKPAWGIYLINTTARTYPYREALDWLKTNHANQRILFTGMYYPYRFDFYFNQLNWTPAYDVFMTEQSDSDSISLSHALVEAGIDKSDLILFQVMGNAPARGDGLGAFVETKIFKNEAYSLIVYARNP